jgi:hypothetical protein
MKYLSVKKSGVLFSISLLAAFLAILTGCVKQNFDEPPINIPHVNFKSNMTIAALRKKFVIPVPIADTANFQVDSTGTMLRVKGDVIIEGIVGGNDESGNIYKEIYIQDTTGGIGISLDLPYIYTQFKVGQRIFVKCKGLYLGQYGTAIQIGYPYIGKIGRMPAALIAGHLLPDSLPGKAPVPIVIDITQTNSNYFDKYQSMLVAFHRVGFSDNAGSQIAPGSSSSSFAIYDSIDEAISLPKLGGKSLILYTSNYSSFSTNKLPSGLGIIQGIFTVYNSSYEMLIRDTKDFINFVDTGQSVIYKNNFDATPPDWVIFTSSGNGWIWGTTSGVTYMKGNGYGGSAPSNTWLISPALDLTNVTNPVLTFSTWTDFTDGGLTNPLEVKVSTDYSGSGDPSTATWSTLQCNLSATNSALWEPSGDITLSAFHQQVYVGFHYRSSGTGASTSASWEVDTFKLTGKKN